MSGSRNFWGPTIWKTIHIMALSYTPDKKDHFKKFINELQYLLPCEECRHHLRQNLKILPIDDYLQNNHQAFMWSYMLHDIVNKQLGKKSPKYEDVKMMYIKGMGPECTSCKIK